MRAAELDSGPTEPQRNGGRSSLLYRKPPRPQHKIEDRTSGGYRQQACEEVRNRVGPAVTMRVDANEYYQSAKEAIVAIRRLERFNLQLVEQPLAAHDYAGHAEVRSAVDTPIGLDETIQSPRDALMAIQARWRRVQRVRQRVGWASARATNYFDRGSCRNSMPGRYDGRIADCVRCGRSPCGCLCEYLVDLRSCRPASL